MSIFFSRQCEYAIQSVIYIALKKNGELTTVKEVAGKLNIPFHFTGKIFQHLSHKDVLTSTKGVSGGYALAKHPDEITLLDIVVAIDGIDFRTKCLLGFPNCGGNTTCAAHDKWSVLREELYELLVSKNLTQLASDMKKPGYQFPL